jgi:hypothetical protein
VLLKSSQPNNSSVRNTHVDLLLDEVQSNGKILPRGLVNGRRPDDVVLSVRNLECILVARLANKRTRLEVELVGAVVGCFMPDVLFPAVLAKQNGRG